MIERRNFAREVRWGILIIVLGTIVYLARSAVRREWQPAHRGVEG